LVAAEGAPAVAAGRTVEQICRAAWGAAPAGTGFVRHQIARLTVHHSGVRFDDNRKAPSTLRAIQADHQAKGWPDIAYHVIIDLNGNVYEGRPKWAVGDTNTAYDPTGHLLVMCLGNFEVQTVPGPQRQAVIDVLAWASAYYAVSPSTIRGHRDFVATACPGQDLYRSIADGTMQQAVAAQVGSVTMTDLCGRAGRQRVRQIVDGTR